MEDLRTLQVSGQDENLGQIQNNIPWKILAHNPA